ncbi:unnamed protein product [Symbiodinium sp. CCMP2592]|nr:unnamed protein product [Symbiodinium sp. CCMP2592]
MAAAYSFAHPTWDRLYPPTNGATQRPPEGPDAVASQTPPQTAGQPANPPPEDPPANAVAEEPLQIPRADLPRRVSELAAFCDPQKVLKMDFSALQGVCNAGVSAGLSEEDRVKEQMNAMAKANHFLNVNGEVLGAEAKSMTTFAAAIGCTSMGKDTTCAQIVNKKDVAVTGKDMTTAANVLMTSVVEPVASGQDADEDHFTVHFHQELKYEGKDPKEYQRTMHEIMTGIRSGDPNKGHHNFTLEPVNVMVRSRSGWPTFILNTIGFTPRPKEADGVFQSIDAMLNDRAKAGGPGSGVLIICQSWMKADEPGICWPELDVIKNRQHDAANPFHIIVALTQGDLYEPINFQACKTFKDVYDTIFSNMDTKLPGCNDKFLVTGWRENDPSDEPNCASKLDKTLAEVIGRISREKPDEQQSPWLRMLRERVGTEKLKQRYNDLMTAQSEVLLTNVEKWLHASLETTNDMLTKLFARQDSISDCSLGHNLLEFCLQVEKMAETCRLNRLDRPSSSPDLGLIEKVTARSAQTLAEELRFVQQAYGVRLSAKNGDLEQVIQELENEDWYMNKEGMHALWQRTARLKDNAVLLAGMYEMPVMKRADIMRFMAATAVQNTADAEHYIQIRVIGHVKGIFAAELVPLLSVWLAHHCHDSYSMALEVVLQEQQFEHLRSNGTFKDIMKGVLNRLYYHDVREFLANRFLTRSPAFLERTCLSRQTRMSYVVHQRKLRQSVETMTDEQQKDFVAAYYPELAPRPKAGPSVSTDSPSASITPLTQEDESSLLNQNTVRPYKTQYHLSVREDEAHYLNTTAQFIFQHFLHKVITHFLDDSEIELDRMYSENCWYENGHLLFKYLYFAVSDEVQARTA